MSFWAGLSAAFTVMQGYNQMQQGKASSPTNEITKKK